MIAISYHGDFSLAGFCSKSQQFVESVWEYNFNADQKAGELDNFIGDPSYYRQTFMTDSKAKEIFGRYFAVEDQIVGVVSRFQNVAVLRKPSDRITNKLSSNLQNKSAAIQAAIQLSGYTAYNKHPTIFAIMQKIAGLDLIKNPVILSFGCSTGEEVFTLNDLYFKDAFLFGLDISSEAIEYANHRLAEMTMEKVRNGNYLPSPTSTILTLCPS
ncbi:MAG: methyltransferase domain-containing protein [Candidatus Competibacteraceae bacterium]|nr:methyltransferase domain-containing protein [Candidatus Competibacteraceae bacterium]